MVDLDQYRSRLQEQERELVERIGRQVSTSRESTDDQVESGDRALVDVAKETGLIEADSDSSLLGEVRAAQARVEAGTYGLCEADGEPIEAKRLEAVPSARFCVRHQQELEEAAGMRTPSL